MEASNTNIVSETYTGPDRRAGSERRVTAGASPTGTEQRVGQRRIPAPVQSPAPIVTPPVAAPPAGMWGEYTPPDIGEPIELLKEAGEFVLVDASLRHGIKTQHGEKTAWDVRVQTTMPGVTRHVSGFTAGIRKQIEMSSPGDLPAVARIIEQPTDRGDTHIFALVSKLDAAADLAAVARTLPTPIAPLAT